MEGNLEIPPFIFSDNSLLINIYKTAMVGSLAGAVRLLKSNGGVRR